MHFITNQHSFCCDENRKLLLPAPFQSKVHRTGWAGQFSVLSIAKKKSVNYFKDLGLNKHTYFTFTCTYVSSSAWGRLFLWERMFSPGSESTTSVMSCWLGQDSQTGDRRHKMKMSHFLGFFLFMYFRVTFLHTEHTELISGFELMVHLLPGLPTGFRSKEECCHLSQVKGTDSHCVLVCVSAHGCISKWARWLFYFFNFFFNVLNYVIFVQTVF